MEVSNNFINNYHINHTYPQHRLLVRYTSHTEQDRRFVSVEDNDTFPQHKSLETAPWSLNTLKHVGTHGSLSGIIFFCSSYREMVVLWNPSVRKSVGIVIPNVFIFNGWTYYDWFWGLSGH